MMEKRRLLSLIALLLSVCSLWFLPSSLPAAEQSIEVLLPPQGFSRGWEIDGKVKRYTPETLYMYIDGEAELYMPFGFEILGTGLYKEAGHPETALVADVYKMGSLLDAFGVYSYYRDPDADAAGVGADGFIDQSQVMFYKDRYFVRLSASGSGTPEQAVFMACAKAIAGMIPGEPTRPKELELLNISGITPRTEKYTAQSVMGYAFFRKGLTVEAVLEGKPVKAFVIIDPSEHDSANTFDSYARYLKEKGAKIETSKPAQGRTLLARDPMYKGVMVRQSRRYILGVSGLSDPAKGAWLIGQLQSRIK